MKKTEVKQNKVSLRLNPMSMHGNNPIRSGHGRRKAGAGRPPRGNFLWKDAVRRFRKNKFCNVVALALIILLFLFAFVGPLLSQYDYDQFNPGQEDQAPNWQHPFGTDRFGRDLLVRNMYGARISLSPVFLPQRSR